MASTKSFPFLDLRKEIRLMVYERIPVTTTLQKGPGVALTDEEYVQTVLKKEPPPQITIVRHSVSLAILRTCRQVREEASDILKLKVDDIRSYPTKIIIDCQNLRGTVVEHGILVHLIRPDVPSSWLSQGVAAGDAFRIWIASGDQSTLPAKKLKTQLQKLVKSNEVPTIEIALTNNVGDTHTIWQELLWDFGYMTMLRQVNVVVREVSAHFSQETSAHMHEATSPQGWDEPLLDLDRSTSRKWGDPIDDLEWGMEWSAGDFYRSSAG
ncbi:hypothetical protein BDV95DRAFT_608113 [Massariosphaeria phaeospora]|uniref:Uncharacterized protein n=1 Tax=Massariosphaeria phaeospora TaxID=100035 RepID=A0A7C8I7H0_9PLEO|nr:hypothetical protein BDV95DRAFT_608113 [Massariosphaeria phaeospora]